MTDSKTKSWITNNQIGVFPSFHKRSAHLARGLIVLIWFLHVINSVKERIRKFACILITWFFVSFSSLITNTTLLRKHLNTKWLSVMPIHDTSWCSPLSHPAQKSCKDSFFASYFANITKTPTTAQVYHSLLFSFRHFLFHTWLLLRINIVTMSNFLSPASNVINKTHITTAKSHRWHSSTKIT